MISIGGLRALLPALFLCEQELKICADGATNIGLEISGLLVLLAQDRTEPAGAVVGKRLVDLFL